MPDEKPKPKINLKFLFLICNDVQAIKDFYVGLLGMEETAFMDEPEFGWLSIRCDGFDFMWFRSNGNMPVLMDWTGQPGYEGGPIEATSWAINIPEEDFAAMYKKLKDSGVKAFSEIPQWRQKSYWGYSVMDPMGNTVEVYTSPKEKPDENEWVD